MTESANWGRFSENAQAMESFFFDEYANLYQGPFTESAPSPIHPTTCNVYTSSIVCYLLSPPKGLEPCGLETFGQSIFC